MEFVQSFYVIFNKKLKAKKLNDDMVKFKETVNDILSQKTFNEYSPLLLPHLSSANVYGRRNAIDILCLFHPETRFIHYDHYGSQMIRK